MVFRHPRGAVVLTTGKAKLDIYRFSVCLINWDEDEALSIS